MQITIISDCRDDNARARQQIRYRSLLGEVVPIFIGVSTDLEAAGCLVDAIDSYQGKPGMIIVNVAPRGNKADYPNGVPFCFHTFGAVTIIGTPNCFSLAVKLGLFSKTSETDVLKVCQKFLPEKEASRIADSQFRSYEYLPYLALWLSQGLEVPAIERDIPKGDIDNKVWYVDCFGNCKTTILDFDQSSQKYPFYEKLADVPKDGNPAFTRGSSGYQDTRFLEVVIQNQSSSSVLNLSIGSEI